MPEHAFVAQRSFDDLGTALHEVTFVVVDLETTGGSPADCAITEVGAVKLRGGECLGTYQTLVDPGCAIPPEITVLTGITQAMVTRAPRIETVLPSLLEFMGDAVLVGHNIRFDRSFLDAALVRLGRPRLHHRSIDTLALARRLVRDEVPNCRLGTLADRLRLSHTPSHRALDDARATGDLLHLLLERAGSLGVTGLDDLLALPTLTGSAHARKLPLTDGLPRAPGVYLFRDARDDVLYVGKAANLRARVRSYFSSDERRKTGALLRETKRIEHRVCRNGLEAAVLEIRLIHRHLPRYNRQGTRSARYPYVKLTLDERFPRLSIVRTVKDDGGLYLGPVASRRHATRLIEAIHTAVPLRRCGGRSTRRTDRSPCAAVQLGVAACPCSGATPPDAYQAIVDDLVAALHHEPDRLLGPLADRIDELARAERFEEAADVRDRADALATALRRGRRFALLREAGRMRLRIGDSWAELDGGLLVGCGHVGEPPELWDPPDQPPAADHVGGVPDRAHADELVCVGAWLDRHAASVELLDVEGILAEPIPAVRSFAARNRGPAHRRTARVDVGASRARPTRRTGPAPVR